MLKLYVFWLASLNELVHRGLEKSSIRGMAIVASTSEENAKKFLAKEFQGVAHVVLVDSTEVPGTIIDPEVLEDGSLLVSYLGPSMHEVYPPQPCRENVRYN